MIWLLEMFRQDFVRNAFLAGTIIALVCAVMGYFVVLRGQAFAGHALSHIGFAGAAGAALVGASSLVGMFVFTLLAALGMGALGERLRGRDIEIGMVLTFALGLGVLFLKLYTQYATRTVNLLFGSIWTVAGSDVVITLGCGIVTLLLLALLYRPLLFASIDPEVAQARGVPVRLLSVVFFLLLAITISEAVLVVGILLVFALLITPAAIAERLAKRPLAALLLAAGLSLLFSWGGLLLALVGRWPASFYIALLTAVAYFIAVRVHRLRTPRRYKPLPHPNRECSSVPARM